MTEASGVVDGQLQLMLPPNGGKMPTRPSDLGLFQPAPVPLEDTLEAPHAAERSYRFRLGGAEFCAIGRRMRGLVEADTPVLIAVDRSSVTLIAKVGADVSYFEEYSAPTTGVPPGGLLFALQYRLVASLGALDAIAEVEIDLGTGRFLARIGNDRLRQGPILPVEAADLPQILEPVVAGAAGAGQDLARCLSQAMLFAAKDDKHCLDRVVVAGGAARASSIDALVELRHGHLGQVSYEVGRGVGSVVIKALSQLPSSVTVMGNAGRHVVGGDGRMVVWSPPKDRVEMERLNASRFRSATSLLLDRQELVRTLAIFGVGLVAGKARIGLRLNVEAELVSLWLESNHPNGIVYSHEHHVRVEGEPLVEPPPTFYLDHVQLERVLARGDGDHAKLDLALVNGAVTAVRYCISDATYLLGATRVPAVAVTHQRRHRNR